MSYFVYIRQRFNPKNKLQQDAMIYLQSLNKIIIPTGQVGKFKTDVEARISELNKANKRCQPLRVLWLESNLETVFLERHGGVEIVDLVLMKVYGKYEKQP